MKWTKLILTALALLSSYVRCTGGIRKYLGGSWGQKLEGKTEELSDALWVQATARPVHPFNYRQAAIRTMLSRKRIKSVKNAEFKTWPKIDNLLQTIAKKSHFGPQSRTNMQMKAGLMLFRAILIALPPETKQNLQISPKKWSRSRNGVDSNFWEMSM